MNHHTLHKHWPRTGLWSWTTVRSGLIPRNTIIRTPTMSQKRRASWTLCGAHTRPRKRALRILMLCGDTDSPQRACGHKRQQWGWAPVQYPHTISIGLEAGSRTIAWFYRHSYNAKRQYRQWHSGFACSNQVVFPAIDSVRKSQKGTNKKLNLKDLRGSKRLSPHLNQALCHFSCNNKNS